METPEEIDRLLAETDPETVVTCCSTPATRSYGGGDPVDVVRRHGGRVRYVHLKDVRADELARVRTTDVAMSEAWARGVFCPLGDGVVDFRAWWSRCAAAATTAGSSSSRTSCPTRRDGCAPSRSQSARRSRAYLRDKVGL